MGKHYDVMVLGDYNVDLIFGRLPHFPSLGSDLLAGSFAQVPGGGSYISAVTMHRLGLAVAWAADFGSDEFSQWVLAKVREEGLSEEFFVFHDRPMRRVTVAMTYPEDRAFVTYYDPEPAIPAAMRALVGISARAVYLPGLYYGPFFDAGRFLVRAKKMKLIMGGNMIEEVTLRQPAVRKVLGEVDVFLPNAREARLLTGQDDLEAARTELGHLCPLVVIKDGSRGAWAQTPKGARQVPALALTPVDTTGAGDCFDAAFVTAWLEGLPLETCLRWGNIAGGLSTLELGGTGRVIRRADIASWLARLEISKGAAPPASDESGPGPWV
jgi:sugar/nucleoside kinase (ribokinase family)